MPEGSLGPGWCIVDGVPSAWFDAPSLSAGARLAERVLALAVKSAVDLRPEGVRVRLEVPVRTEAVSQAAAELGLEARAEALQQVSVVIESPQPNALRPFWRRVLGYANNADGLADPLGDTPATADWHTVFSAIACYRTTSRAQQHALASTAAHLVERASFPLLIDLRPGVVVLDSGKDRWETHGPDVDFPALAAQVQTAAHELGATPDTRLPQLVQLFLDAADVEGLRAFWARALDYRPDERAEVTDLVDPRRVDPILVMQPVDTTETARLRQRNRLHVELAVPAQHAEARAAQVLDAGGRLLHEQPGRWTLADPEGNELVVAAG